MTSPSFHLLSETIPNPLGIVCTATATYRTHLAENQDACASFCHPDFQLVVVADGLGSFAHSGHAAKFCVQSLVQQVEKEGDLPCLHTLFAQCQPTLSTRATKWHQRLPLPQQALLNLDQSFGTTCLLAAETPSQLMVAYLGNGGIFRLPGNFIDFPDTVRLPWVYVNLLNPHTRMENGREALYRYFSPHSTEYMVEPTVLTLNKDTRFGDVLIIVTDGIYSYDQVLRGQAEGQLWISGEETMVALHQTLRDLFLTEELTTESLQAGLNAYLNDLKARDLLDDDATIGVIVTAEALRYQQEVQGRR